MLDVTMSYRRGIVALSGISADIMESLCLRSVLVFEAIAACESVEVLSFAAQSSRRALELF